HESSDAKFQRLGEKCAIYEIPPQRISQNAVGPLNKSPKRAWNMPNPNPDEDSRVALHRIRRRPREGRRDRMAATEAKNRGLHQTRHPKVREVNRRGWNQRRSKASQPAIHGAAVTFTRMKREPGV